MLSPVNIREIRPTDLNAIFDVRVKTWHNPHGAKEMRSMGITHESVGQMLAESHRGWLAEYNHRVVGFTMGNRCTGEMWVIAVMKECENQGLGRRLMRRVESWLFSEGHCELWLTTDTNEDYRAVGFYRQLGWEDWKIENGDRYMRKCIG